jgi:hypothetical protein
MASSFEQAAQWSALILLGNPGGGETYRAPGVKTLRGIGAASDRSPLIRLETGRPRVQNIFRLHDKRRQAR